MSRSTVSDSADSSCLFALSEGRFGGLLSTGVYCGGHESADSCCTSYFSEGGLGASSVEDADLLALQLFPRVDSGVQCRRDAGFRSGWMKTHFIFLRGGFGASCDPGDIWFELQRWTWKRSCCCNSTQHQKRELWDPAMTLTGLQRLRLILDDKVAAENHQENRSHGVKCGIFLTWLLLIMNR